ncbi:CDP-glucose 4,6-dehydratase [Paenibacillus xylaniclasticus]|uniref:CDP-glucose 4,6-dehydratase n=1 Tax=Paenibacillus xylaniclasticus TaxID=588083 RepID=UPI000FDBE2D4|nr:MULTISPECIES: CDP-glucose 4,6-dehydratase [Paenibacillus]GFN31960.1 CDP-glucose 4,6-dehydratase [Paenibacillus curdlanolyticus]
MSGKHQFWQGKRVLITGHTGFKGTWLSLWLRMRGAEVIGYSDGLPTETAMYRLCGLELDLPWIRGDIRDSGKLQQSMRDTKPDIVFHLAAQPLVRRSYAIPAETIAVNVTGTANVLDAVRRQPSVRVVVAVTSDKCYENQQWEYGYREQDALGGADPYSVSKACAELVVDAYRRSYFSRSPGAGRIGAERKSALGIAGASVAAVATVRAGNVIGGGDFAPERLVPDCVRSAQSGTPLLLRYPEAIRPWQHVLDPLSGYIALAERLYEQGDAYAESWNFGPLAGQELTVRELACAVSSRLGAPAPIEQTGKLHPHETAVLRLDSSKARHRLGWRPVWEVEGTVRHTAEWYAQWLQGAPMLDVTMKQVKLFETMKQNRKAEAGRRGQSEG